MARSKKTKIAKRNPMAAMLGNGMFHQRRIDAQNVYRRKPKHLALSGIKVENWT